MDSRHVILRVAAPDMAELFAPAPVRAAAPLADLLRVDVAELGRSELADVRRDPRVRAIAPSMPTKLIEPLPVETSATTAWGVQAVAADTSPFDGRGIKVAVLDTGIEKSHEAFQSGPSIQEQNFTGESGGDRHGHGTHVAGTIFGGDVGGTRIGVARGIDTALIGKVLASGGNGSTESIFEAILWADEQGADIISMSLGIDFPGYVKRLEDRNVPTEMAVSMALEAYRANLRAFDALSEWLTAWGINTRTATCVTAAAGNESRREEDPDWEIIVAPPAATDGFISVGALGQTGDAAAPYTVAPFSNTGPNVAAPGVEIPSAKLGGGLVAWSGTSMATPHVAGVAALWAQRLRDHAGFVSQAELAARVVGSAVTIDGADSLDVGAGLIRAPQ